MSPEASLPEYKKKEGGRDGRREREGERERERKRESGWVASRATFSVMFVFTGRDSQLKERLVIIIMQTMSKHNCYTVNIK